MRKVLIVSYHAPPSQATAAFRIGALKDYLPSFGWEPTIVSGPPSANLMSQLANIKTKLGVYRENSWVDKAASLYGEVFFYPDPMRKWADKLDIQKIYDSVQPDIVMSHSFPHSSHIAACGLNRSVPWIVSMGDLWTKSHFYPYSRFRQQWENRLEQDTLRRAKAFITVTPTLGQTLQENYWQHVYVIPNGYPDSHDVPLTKEFTMTYTGTFYPDKYDIELFCWTLKWYQYVFPNLVVRFYGTVYPYLKYLVTSYGLTNVKFMGTVSHADALKAQKESHLLLHFAWNDPKYQGVYSAKLMEYLGAKRPIISFGGKDNAVGALLDETCAGVWCETPDSFGLVMGHCHRQFLEKGAPTYNGIPEEVAKYSQRSMAQQHAELFDRLV